MTDALMYTDTNGDAHVVGVMSDNAKDIKYGDSNVEDALDTLNEESIPSLETKIDAKTEIKTATKTYTSDTNGHFSFGSDFNNGNNVLNVFCLNRQANRFVTLYTWGNIVLGNLSDGVNSIPNEQNSFKVVYFE